MSDKQLCPECSTRKSDSSPSGPCPACLMKLGMSAWMKNTGAPTSGRKTVAPQGLVPPIAGASVGEEIGLSPGKLERLFPKLEILHLVGQGGMGAVYCARQKSLNRLVALKIVLPDAQKRGDFESRFAREARALASLNHKNIITVHDFGQAEDIYFFVMEYVDGINLRQMLLGQQLTPTQALQIVPAICDALQYAHDHGVVHRDIKPENILIDTEGKIKIADFGLAKLLDHESTVNTRLTQDHQVMGTMHYMAPEQIEHPMDVDHRADIYSLGVVFYELLTGELPLGRFAPPSEKVRVDIRLDEIVLQTLAKEPSLRYQKVSDVKSDMQSIHGESVRQPTPQPPIAHPTVAEQIPASYVATVDHVQPVAPVKQNYPGTSIPRSTSRTGALPKLGFWAAWADLQSYKNILYVLLAFPLGIIYFVLVVVGLSVGISTVIIWIGLAILLGTFWLVRGSVALERTMVRGLLNTDVASRRVPASNRELTVGQRTLATFYDGQNWRGILYLLVKFPLGVATFVSCVCFLTIPLALMAAPILMLTPVGGPDMVFWHADTPFETGFLACLGGLLAIGGIHVINGLAWLHAGWAQLCLGKPR